MQRRNTLLASSEHLAILRLALRKLPVAINGYLGDALQDSQWADTLCKLESLCASNHRGAIMVPTKKLITRGQIRLLQALNKEIWIFFAVTGLDELGLGSFDPYEKAYFELCSNFSNVVCAYRPIIPNHNDNRETAGRIIDMVSRGNRLLTYTGYKDIGDPEKPVYQNPRLFQFIKDYCLVRGVTVRQKCSEIIAAVCGVNLPGEVDMQTALNLLHLIGYQVKLNQNKIGFCNNDRVSKGDLNFIRILTGFECVLPDRTFSSQILSISQQSGLTLVSSSSWFQWARQVDCSVSCSYCFAAYHSTIRTEPPSFGCNPADLADFLMRV